MTNGNTTSSLDHAVEGIETFSLEESATRIGQRPEWVAARLRSGEFSGYKIGRKWRMSATDIATAVSNFRREAKSPLADRLQSGLSVLSARRAAR